MTESDEGDKALNDDAASRSYVISKIQRGLADIEAGRVVDDAEVARRLSRWLVE